MREYYKKLALLRRDTDALKTGNCAFYEQGDDVLGILRYCIDGRDAFGTLAQDGMYLTLVNRGKEPHHIAVDLFAREELILEEHTASFREFEFEGAVCKLTDETYPVNEGLVEAMIPPESIRILEIEWI